MVTILEVAAKSGHLKGTFVRKLKDAAESLQGIVESLVSRSMNEETRRVAADNARLRREVDSLKAEIKARKRQFNELKANPPAALMKEDALEEMRASLISSVGALIEAKLPTLKSVSCRRGRPALR